MRSNKIISWAGQQQQTEVDNNSLNKMDIAFELLDGIRLEMKFRIEIAKLNKPLLLILFRVFRKFLYLYVSISNYSPAEHVC